MLHRWLPWKFIVKKAAKAYGIVDPISVIAKLRRFAQPSEVQEPIELLRAGIVFHARGLINTKAIQHNLDWVWPYWVERQFNPRDVSFIPRAFSFSHVNLTHRNWTAVGLPGLALYPIIDPRGLFTPLYDGWSLDLWLRLPDGSLVLPSRLREAEQCLHLEPTLQVETSFRDTSWQLRSSCSLLPGEEQPQARMHIQTKAPSGSNLVLALRPYNPEGIQFIEKASYNPTAGSWLVNSQTQVLFSRKPEQVLFSDYTEGDVVHKLDSQDRDLAIDCKVGMATGAALFHLPDESEQNLEVKVPLPVQEEKRGKERKPRPGPRMSWPEAVSQASHLQIPESQLSDLYRTAVHTLVLLSGQDVVPGPYTYRRFWFRDACFMLHALLILGFEDTAARIIEAFPQRQKRSGYFLSQAGEWDSNGQVLWLLDRFEQLSSHRLSQEWIHSIRSGVKWIHNKRVSGRAKHLHAGLLPAGFSAEHLGPNDYYYWDNFWAAAGLQSAARILARHGYAQEAETIDRQAAAYLQTIWNSIRAIPDQRRKGGIPASPYRRLDAGAVGSLAADYPLQLTPAGDPWIMTTVDYLLQNCFHQGGFFQDMIHSGINPYLTLDIAQSLLRSQDPHFLDLVRTVADLASPTGQWPEAIHPLTGGGCMGDGQHGWAASELVMIVRNMFILEEESGLRLGSGIDPAWLQAGQELAFGPTLTSFGRVSVHVAVSEQGHTQGWVTGSLDPGQTRTEIMIPGYAPVRIQALNEKHTLVRAPA